MPSPDNTFRFPPHASLFTVTVSFLPFFLPCLDQIVYNYPDSCPTTSTKTPMIPIPVPKIHFIYLSFHPRSQSHIVCTHTHTHAQYSIQYISFCFHTSAQVHPTTTPRDPAYYLMPSDNTPDLFLARTKTERKRKKRQKSAPPS